MISRSRGMHRNSIVGSFLVLLLAGTASAAPPAGGPHPRPRMSHRYHPKHILVRFKPAVAANVKQVVNDAAGAAKTLREFRAVEGLQLVELKQPNVEQALAAYRRDPRVLYAEPDYEVYLVAVPDDPDFSLLWGLQNTGQDINGDPGIPGADIRAVDAWNLWTGDPEFRIAVIDTGVNYNHPDLGANVWTNPGEIPGNNIDDDGNGWIDDVHGFDFADGDGDPLDQRGHGSHVAGTIGAVGNNAFGPVGVNWQCKIVALKIFSQTGSAFTGDAIAAVQYVIDNNIRVSNSSWGGAGYTQAMFDVIEAAQAVGHIFVAAAGNDAVSNEGTPHYPSSYDLPNIIAVAATDNDDNLASFSNWGLTSVDLGAPGVAIYSTIHVQDGYAYLSGTSMASPHVTGVVALVTSRSPQLTWQEVRDRVLGSVRLTPALDGITVTGGVVNAVAALGDCNANGIDDSQDIANGTSEDCTSNGVPDECEPDCNDNGVADSCDIALGTSQDCDGFGKPDECEPDCNTNGVADQCDISSGISGDCNFNGLPDDCEPGGSDDCNGNGNADLCDFFQGLANDCNRNIIPDTCDIAAGTSEDCNANLTPDECEVALTILMAGDASVEFVQSIEDLGHQVSRIGGGLLSFPNDLSIYDVLMILPRGIPSPEDWFAEIIDEFVEAGGGLLRIQDPPNFAFQFRGFASPVLDAVGWVRRSDTQVLNPASPLVSGLGSISTLTGFSASYTLKPEAEVVIEWGDGEPMTVIHQHGAGTVVYFNNLWAAYPSLWEGDQTYGLTLMKNALEFVKSPSADCNLNHIPDDCDISAGTSEDCSGNGTPDECEPDCNGNGVADSCDIVSGTSDDDDGNGVPDECSIIFYVDRDATGLGSGSTWADAFTDLEEALTSASLIAGAGVDTQIWVAEGTYTPSRRTDPDDARSATFQLLKFVTLSGGFRGGEADFSERSVRNNVVILSGDFAGNDQSGFVNYEENAYHVLTANETGHSAVLDGFTITGGNAYEGGQNDWRARGGGMLNFDGRPIVTNCTFTANRAFDGAGIYDSGPSGDSLIVTNCAFIGNSAGRNGGGVLSANSEASFVNCLFSGNKAGTDPNFCGRGAGLNARGDAHPVFINCTFAGNETSGGPCAGHGGGLANTGNIVATVSNCVFWNNHDTGPTDFTAQIAHEGAAISDINYSCIMGWTNADGGVGNISASPAFADPDGPDNIAGTLDDNLRLTATSSCIDAADNIAVPSDVTDLDLDGNTAEQTPVDADGAPRFFDDPSTADTGRGFPPIVDMGAYEYSDCNANGITDSMDIADGTSDDCNGNGVPDECEPDCNLNGVADSCDITGATAQDCNANGVPDECDIAQGRDNDCNDNGAPDTCDIAAGTSEDCTGNGLPDECEPDCNSNGAADSCDIADATAPDCNTNGVPDGCDIAVGSNADCNDNGIPDVCDVAAGTSEDCTENGVPDECDIIEGRNDDCDDNGIPDVCEFGDCNANGALDVCDIRDGISLDTDGDGMPDECCIPPAIYPDTLGPRNRYLSFGTGEAGSASGEAGSASGDAGRAATSKTIGDASSVAPLPYAVRVTLLDLPAPFDGLNATTMWVGPPREICENSGQGQEMQAPEDCAPAAGLSRDTFWSATLQCQPYYTDWSTQGKVYVHHEVVVPGGTYALQTIIEGCGLTLDGNYSTALTMTQSRWGDVCGPSEAGACSAPPDGTVDVASDVLGVLGKFANTFPLEKSRADLEPGEPDLKVNVANDVLFALDAFTGAPYPFVPGNPCGPG